MSSFLKVNLKHIKHVHITSQSNWLFKQLQNPKIQMELKSNWIIATEQKKKKKNWVIAPKIKEEIKHVHITWLSNIGY